MALKMQDGGAAQPAAEPLPAAKKTKLLPIILIVVVLAAAGAGFAVFKGKLLHKHGKAAPVVIKVGETLPLDEFMLNLADPSNDHYLKVTIALGLKQGVSADSFKDKVPETRDAIVMVLTSKRLDELRSTAGKEELKNELMDAVNKAVGERDVAAVYFEAFATQ